MFIGQEVTLLLQSKEIEDNIRGCRLFQEHNLTVAPSKSYAAGDFPVWRPHLRADSLCGACNKLIKAKSGPALWGGQAFHYGCWHLRCWRGQYDVNTKERSAYQSWLSTLPNAVEEQTRWHRISQESE